MGEKVLYMKTEAPVQLCYVPMYQLNSNCFKVAFNNCRSLHKHFLQVKSEPNILASDVVSFSEIRLCSADEDNYLIMKLHVT